VRLTTLILIMLALAGCAGRRGPTTFDTDAAIADADTATDAAATDAGTDAGSGLDAGAPAGDGGTGGTDSGAPDAGTDAGTAPPVCTPENLATETDPPSTACDAFRSWAESYGADLCGDVPDCPWVPGEIPPGTDIPRAVTTACVHGFRYQTTCEELLTWIDTCNCW